jgi:hypothetical protein
MRYHRVSHFGTGTTGRTSGILHLFMSFLYLCNFTLQTDSLHARLPSSMEEYRALMGSERPVRMSLSFRSIQPVDTDYSIEDRFLFTSNAGIRFYVQLEWNHQLALEQVRDGNELAPFRAKFVYDLDLRLESQTDAGLLLARATPAEVWELRLTRQIPPYTGDITEQDMRVREVIRDIRENEPLPESFKLFFSRRETLHLVFYDLEGNEMRFQYRPDRWEVAPLEEVKFLIPGSAYLVKGTLRGLQKDNQTVPVADQRFVEIIEKAALETYFLVFDYEEAIPLRTDQILY